MAIPSKKAKPLLSLFMLFTFALLYSNTYSYAQESSFTTSNDRSLYDAQTRALRQKARTQLEKDTEKLKELKQTNEDLQNQTARIEECADLDKVYNGDPTGSNDPNTYCQAIVGALPSEINFKGLSAWYDVSTEDGYELDGNTISKLLDKSGNLNHLTTVTATKPELVTTSDYSAKAASNVKAIRFTGSEYLQSASNKMATALGIKGNYSASIFAVFAHDSSALGTSHYGIFGFGNPSVGGQTGILNTTTYTVHHQNMGHKSAWTTNNERLILMDYHKTASTNNLKISINGVQTDTDVSTGTPNVQDGYFYLGRWNSGSSYTMRGDFAELIIYNRDLSSTERASVQAYLINKYNLAAFQSCANKTVNTGQCSVSTGTANHSITKDLSCTGTYNKPCTNTQYCNDGTWEQKSNSCPPPDNCTTATNKTLSDSYSSCTASTGTGNHGTNASLSCSGTFGPCTATSNCYNGVWGAPTSVSCVQPVGCGSSSKTISHTYGTCTASVAAGGHGSTKSLSCAGTFGTCTAQTTCYNGTWGNVQNANCPAPSPCHNMSASLYHCSINTGTSLAHDQTKTYGCAHPTYKHYCRRPISCYNGAITLGTLECAPGCYLASGKIKERLYNQYGILYRTYTSAEAKYIPGGNQAAYVNHRLDSRTSMDPTITTSYQNEQIQCATSYTTKYTTLSVSTTALRTSWDPTLPVCKKNGTKITCPTSAQYWREVGFKSDKNKNKACATTDRPFKPTLGESCAAQPQSVSKSYACRDRIMKSWSHRYRIHECNTVAR